jgi:hypothetical protein
VLGVDRSGSSLCANLLQEFGIDLGDDLIGANEFNQRGYFESAWTFGVNEAIFAALGRSWDELYNARPLGAEWWRAPEMQEWLDRIVLLLQTRMGQTPGLFGLKDPRFCVLLPLWQEAFALCGLSPRYILTLRRPTAVAKSLAARSGFSASYSYLYWLERYCFAIETIRDAPHRVIDYENWFTIAREQAHSLVDFLGLNAERTPAEVSQQVQRVVDPDLRHNDSETTSQFETVERLYLCLKAGWLPNHADTMQFLAAEDVTSKYSIVLAEEGSHELRRSTPSPPVESLGEAAGPETAVSSADQLAHYLLSGGTLDCAPYPLFDTSYYLQQYPDVEERGVNPLSDYAASGALEGRCPNPLFDSLYYLERYPDVKACGMNPLGHYILYGAKDNRDPHPLFNTALYKAANPEIEATGANPLAHYLLSGATIDCDLHPLFDTSYYLEQYPDVKERGVSPLVDYLAHGAREGRFPNPLFDSLYYLERYPDVKACGMNPLCHYILFGAKENRDPHPLFDTARYKAANPEIESSGTNPLAHYLLSGATLDCDPHPLFDTAYYLQQYPDVKERGVNPLVDYLAHGAPEGRSPNPLFDSLYYFERYPDVKACGMNPLCHYILFGAKDNRDPHPLFDTARYKAANPEIEVSGVNPLAHYLLSGATLGCDPHPLFDTSYYLEEYPEVKERGVNPLVDFLADGMRKQRNPHPLFLTAYYLQSGGALGEVNPLVHYLSSGWLEGRNPNPLFDTEFYLWRVPAIRGVVNPLVHYCTVGERSGCLPSSLFDVQYYRERYSHAVSPGESLLAHYLHKGGNEDRNPNPLFDSAYYRERYPEIGTSNPLIDYVHHGWKQERCPHPLFDASYYLQRYMDVARAGMDPLYHYLFFGGREGRDPHPLFDASYYMEQITLPPGEGINPLIHYLEQGARAGLDPHPLFHTKFYLEQYPDVAASGENPLVHYLRLGGRERRDPNPLFSGERYFAEHLKGLGEDVNPLLHFLTEQFYDSSVRTIRLADDLPARVGGEKRWRSDLAALKFTPLISILLPVYNTRRRYLRLAIESVLRQAYPFWELCIVDDGSNLAETRECLDSYAHRDSRIHVLRRTENGGISGATNQAMGLALGDWIAMLDHDDELTPDALLELVKAINQDLALDAVYSDHDVIEADGTLAQNFYKPDWSPELMLGVMYICHLLTVRTSVAREAGGFDPRFDNVQDFEFMLRVSERTRHIGHVSKVLYHWRKIPGSIAAGGDEKRGIEALQAAAVNAHMGRRGLEAQAVSNPAFGHRLEILPRSSAAGCLTLVVDVRNVSCGIEEAIDRLIPSKHNIQVLVDAGDTIPPSIDGLQFVDRTTAEPWFKNIRGDYLVYVDGTLEPCSTDWLDHLLLFASNREIGCVAPILLREPNRVANTGLILKRNGNFGFSMSNWPSDADGYLGEISCAHNISAVSGECWMIASSRLENPGLNVNMETLRLQGVELSLRCLEAGYRNVCNPRARFQITRDGRGELSESFDGLLVRDLSARMFLRGDSYSNPNLDISEVS